MGKKQRKSEKVKVKEGKRVKKLTQEQQDILDLARQVMRLDETVREMKVITTNQAVLMRLLEQRLRSAGEALAGAALP